MSHTQAAATSTRTPGPRKPSRVPRPPALTVTVPTTSAMVGVGITSIRRLIASGELRSTVVAGRRVVFVSSIEELLNEQLPD
jgi:hypothetical protein